jgi:diguanylate cyclase (GGDEF)-like protein
MLGNLLKLKNLLLLALGFVVLHALSILVFPAHTTAATYPFAILAPSLALFAVCWSIKVSSPHTLIPRILLAAGLCLWTTGILLSAWEELFQNISASVAFYSDFAFFLYGVPVLLAISFPRQEHRIPLFIWLDAIQALLAAYLTYITLFAVIPFTTHSIHPIPESLLVLVYNVENVVLAVVATLRVLARPESGEERRFHEILCAFLWNYAIFVGIYNAVSVVIVFHSLVDPLSDLPFLFLFVVTILPEPRGAQIAVPKTKGPATIFIENASPIFYTLGLLVLGVAVSRQHFYIGIAAVVVAISVYGLRTTILQGRYMQSQQALQKARDRLEEMSLKDGLTDVANRRCFDQTLESEWNRAVRAHHPLALLLIDVDHFKNLNDRYGHRYGDQCLISIAFALRAALPRSGDLLARYGGEEFAALLPATGSGGANTIAAKMQQAVQSLQIENETPIGSIVSVSIGIAVYQLPQQAAPDDLVEASDRALYKAKQNGRNRIEFASIETAIPSQRRTGD